jgi:hypothetical protein
VKQLNRQEAIDKYRKMADWLEAHPDVPVPHGNACSGTWLSLEDARKAMHLSGSWTKAYSENQVEYEHEVAPGLWFWIWVSRSEVCQRVQVGTKHVEAHDEPVFEWKCGPEDNPESDEQQTGFPVGAPPSGGETGYDACRP